MADIDDAPPDPRLLRVIQEIAEGRIASTLLEAFGGFLDGMVELALKQADRRMDQGTNSPSLSDATLHEIAAYRRLKSRLVQKQDRGAKLQARMDDRTADGLPPAA